MIETGRPVDQVDVSAPGAPAINPLASAWIDVAGVAGGTTYNAQPGQQKFRVDMTSGPVTINLAAVADAGLVIVKVWKNPGGANVCQVVAPAGATIDDPLNPGGTGAASGRLTSAGATVCWQYALDKTEFLGLWSFLSP